MYVVAVKTLKGYNRSEEVYGSVDMSTETIGERLRVARRRKGLTLAVAGRAIGREANTVWRWEHGYMRISALDLVRMAEALDVTVAWLSGVDDALTPEEVQLIRMYRRASPILRASTSGGLRAGLQTERRIERGLEGEGRDEEDPGRA